MIVRSCDLRSSIAASAPTGGVQVTDRVSLNADLLGVPSIPKTNNKAMEQHRPSHLPHSSMLGLCGSYESLDSEVSLPCGTGKTGRFCPHLVQGHLGLGVGSEPDVCATSNLTEFFESHSPAGPRFEKQQDLDFVYCIDSTPLRNSPPAEL
jgi:hypothetical protein